MKHILILSFALSILFLKVRAQGCQMSLTITNQGNGLIDGYATLSTSQSTLITIDYGDNTIGTTGNQFSHVYQNNGTYTICASHTDSLTGCFSSDCDTVVITNIPPPAASCPSAITYTVGQNGLVTLTSASVPDSGFSIVQANWYDINGNIISNNLNQVIYATPSIGYYDFCISITTTSGCNSYSCEQIFINTDSAGNNGNCYAGFTNLSGGSPYAFFLATGSLDSATISFSWDFGDGQTGTNPHGYHTYTQTGIYNVCLTTINSQLNCTNTVCQTISITVQPPPACTVSFNTTVSTMNSQEIIFTNFMTGIAPFSYNYDYGDNTMGSTSTHIYADTTFHGACVTMTDAVGCQAQYCGVLNWPPANLCNASFQIFPDTSNGSAPGTWYVYNYSTSSGAALNYTWDFGDGNISNQTYPTHTYAMPGHYDVCLYIQNLVTNCSDSYCDTSSVHRATSINSMSSITVLPNPTVIKNIDKSKNISVSPNPSNGTAFLNVTGATNSNLKVYDMLGNLVSSNKCANANYQLDISALNAGTYILTINDNNTVVNKKFVVTK